MTTIYQALAQKVVNEGNGESYLDTQGGGRFVQKIKEQVEKLLAEQKKEKPKTPEKVNIKASKPDVDLPEIPGENDTETVEDTNFEAPVTTQELVNSYKEEAKTNSAQYSDDYDNLLEEYYAIDPEETDEKLGTLADANRHFSASILEAGNRSYWDKNDFVGTEPDHVEKIRAKQSEIIDLTLSGADQDEIQRAKSELLALQNEV